MFCVCSEGAEDQGRRRKNFEVREEERIKLNVGRTLSDVC